MHLYDLKTLQMKKAFGIDQTPYFSWKFESESQNVLQVAYQIRLSLRDKLIWDSGKIESSEQSFVLYDGITLNSRVKYDWQVTVWDNHGEKAQANAYFETAFLSPQEDWKAKWIASTLPREAVTKYKFGDTFAPVMFERQLTLSDQVSEARLYASAFGVYQLAVNHQKPDDREFAPEFTVYNDILYYQTYDVTELLKKGENKLEIYVSDGWYFSGQTGPVIPKVKEPAIIYQLEITYTSGEKEIFYSEGSEQTSNDYIVYSDLFQGESQDLRRLNQTKSSEQLYPVLVKDYGYDMLQAQPMPPVRPMKLLPAQKVFQTPTGEWIVDFGQVLCGRARIVIEQSKDTEMSFEYFEVLDNTDNYINTMFAPQKDTVIANGQKHLHEALFTFHGFRYIKVTGMGEPKKEDFIAVLLTTEKENFSTFESSDDRLNRLYQNIRWSQANNMMSIPTDCPTREKAGWTGDILIYAKTALMNENMTPFLSSWLKNVIADQQEDGVVMITTPFANLYSSLLKSNCATFGDDKPTGVAGWSDAIVWVPYTMYQVTGNTIILKDTYQAMTKWCDYIIQTAKAKRGVHGFPEKYDQYLWNTGFHFGEWLIPSHGDQPGFEICKASSYYMTPFFGYKTLVLMSEVSRVLGDTEKADYYENVANEMKHAIQMTLFKEDKLPRDLMGAYVVAFAFDLVPDELFSTYHDRLVKLIHDNGNCLDTGFLATPFLLDALDKIGENQLAHKLLWQNKMPSWLYQVDNDATSIWEAWDADLARKTGRFISFDHYALGSVDDWICRRICGIDSDTPGFSHVVIAPNKDERLTYCRRSFISEAGEIKVNWTHETLSVSIPCNATATVHWMDNKYEIGSGEYTWPR